MSIQAIFDTADRQRKALDFHMSIDQPVDYSGKVCGKPRFRGLSIMLEADRHTDLFSWATHHNMAKQIELRITPVDLTSKSEVIILRDAHCVKYKFHYNHESPLPPTVELFITAAGFKWGSAEHSEYWQTTPFVTVTPTVVEEPEDQKNPSLDSMGWLDENDDRKVETAEFGDKVRIAIKTTDIDVGESVKAELYAKSGNNIEGSATKSHTAIVEETFGSTYAIANVVIDEAWGINKAEPDTNLIDTLLVKATYNSIKKDFADDALDVVARKLKGIYFEKGKDKAYYFEGKLYSATKDKKGMVPYTEKPRRQFRETKEALDKIYSKPDGKKFIDDIVERSNPQFITITRKYAKNFTSNLKVSWSPGDNFGGLDENGDTKRETFLSLAHELWHAWENWTNPAMPNPIWVQKTKDNRLEEPIRNKELTASNFENKIRNEHKLPKRKWYFYVEEEDGSKTGYGKIF